MNGDSYSHLKRLSVCYIFLGKFFSGPFYLDLVSFHKLQILRVMKEKTSKHKGMGWPHSGPLSSLASYSGAQRKHHQQTLAPSDSTQHPLLEP